MPTQFVTVKKSQAEFADYLWGRTQNAGQRAIPVKTYSLGTPEESVTFELRNVADIVRPGFFSFFAALIKVNSFILILFPLFYVLYKNYSGAGYLNPFGILFAAVSAVLLFAGLNIRNDVYDHISGFDRVNIDLNRKPIKLGWISARKASQISLGFIVVAGLFAVLAALVQPKLGWIIAGALLLFLLGSFIRNNSYKQQHSGELILFVLAGPALAAGFHMAAGAAVDNEILNFGVLWGFVVLYLIQVNNFSHIMTSSQSGIKNSMTKLGFDLSQKFLISVWGVIIALNLVFHLNYFGSFMAIVNSAVLIAVSFPTMRKISNIKSPMGSGLQVIRRDVRRNFLVLIGLFLLEIFWNFWRNSF